MTGKRAGRPGKEHYGHSHARTSSRDVKRLEHIGNLLCLCRFFLQKESEKERESEREKPFWKFVLAIVQFSLRDIIW